MTNVTYGPKFRLGRTFSTPGAIKEVPFDEMARALDRHVSGDWGDVSAEDKTSNDDALKNGSRLLSSYLTKSGTKFWILTEAIGPDGTRASTCLLLPSEY